MSEEEFYILQVHPFASTLITFIRITLIVNTNVSTFSCCTSYGLFRAASEEGVIRIGTGWHMLSLSRIFAAKLGNVDAEET